MTMCISFLCKQLVVNGDSYIFSIAAEADMVSSPNVPSCHRWCCVWHVSMSHVT